MCSRLRKMQDINVRNNKNLQNIFVHPQKMSYHSYQTALYRQNSKKINIYCDSREINLPLTQKKILFTVHCDIKYVWSHNCFKTNTLCSECVCRFGYSKYTVWHTSIDFIGSQFFFLNFKSLLCINISM